MSKAWQRLADDPAVWRRICLPFLRNLGLSPFTQGNLKHLYLGQRRAIFNWQKGTFRTINFYGHTDIILAILCVGELLVSASADSTIRLWNVATMSAQAVLEGHTGAVNCIAFLGPHRLVSGADDRSLRIWDLTTATCQCAHTMARPR